MPWEKSAVKVLSTFSLTWHLWLSFSQLVSSCSGCPPVPYFHQNPRYPRVEPKQWSYPHIWPKYLRWDKFFKLGWSTTHPVISDSGHQTLGNHGNSELTLLSFGSLSQAKEMKVKKICILMPWLKRQVMFSMLLQQIVISPSVQTVPHNCKIKKDAAYPVSSS